MLGYVCDARVFPHSYMRQCNCRALFDDGLWFHLFISFSVCSFLFCFFFLLFFRFLFLRYTLLSYDDDYYVHYIWLCLAVKYAYIYDLAPLPNCKYYYYMRLPSLFRSVYCSVIFGQYAIQHTHTHTRAVNFASTKSETHTHKYDNLWSQTLFRIRREQNGKKEKKKMDKIEKNEKDVCSML